MKLNTIRGEVHLFAIIYLIQLTWKMCPQPSLMHGSEPRPLTQQIVQKESSSVPSYGNIRLLGSSALAFAMHSAFKHGKHSNSPLKPLHGWPHGRILLQFSLNMSLHSFLKHTSASGATSPLTSSWLANSLPQNRHFLLCKCL